MGKMEVRIRDVFKGNGKLDITERLIGMSLATLGRALSL
jgi:hypothetical protein